MTTLSRENSNISFPPISKEAILAIFKTNVQPHSSLISFFDSMPEVFSKDPIQPENLSRAFLPDPKDVFYPTGTTVTRPHQQQPKDATFTAGITNNRPQQQPKPFQKKKYIVPKNPFTASGMAENPNAKVWYYIDESETTQGPFTSSEMDGWFEEGYFTHDLPLRFKNQGEFRKLNEVIGKAEYTQLPTNPNQFSKGPFVKGEHGGNQQQGYGYQSRTGTDNNRMRNNEGEGARPNQGFMRGNVRDNKGASDNQGWNRNQGYMPVKTQETTPQKGAAGPNNDNKQEGKVFARATKDQDEEKQMLIHEGQKPVENLEAKTEKAPEEDTQRTSNKPQQAAYEKVETSPNKPEDPEYKPVPQAAEEETSEWTSITKIKPKKKQGKEVRPQPAKKPEPTNVPQQKTEPANLAQQTPAEIPQKVAEKALPVEEEEKKPLLEKEPTKVEPPKEVEKPAPSQPTEAPKEPEINLLEAPKVQEKEPELKIGSLPTEIDTYGVLPSKGKKSKGGKKTLVTGWLGEDSPPPPTKAKEVAKPSEQPTEMDFPVLGDFTKVVKKAPPKTSTNKNIKVTDEEAFQQQRELELQLERQQQVEKAAQARQQELERIRLQQQRELELKQKEKEEAEFKKTQPPVVTTDEFPSLGFPSLSATSTQKAAPKKTGKGGNVKKEANQAAAKKVSAANPKYLDDFPSL